MNYDQLMQDHEEHHRQEGTYCEYADLMSMLLNWADKKSNPSYTELRNNWEQQRQSRRNNQ